MFVTVLSLPGDQKLSGKYTEQYRSGRGFGIKLHIAKTAFHG